MDRLKGKVALITGGGTGLGRACMEMFAREGAKVVAAGRTRASLDETVALVRAAGGEADAVVADMADDAAGDVAVDFTVARFGRLDILVHSAGVGFNWQEKSPGSMNAIDTLEPDKWREINRINLDGTYVINRAAVRQMLKQNSGSIVNVGSFGGMRGIPMAHAYAASKAGMINLTRSLAVTYAGQNIRANCVAPGWIDTPMSEGSIQIFDDPVVAQSISPMARPGTPEEIAYACLFLASDESSFCTGTVLMADGGASATL